MSKFCACCCWIWIAGVLWAEPVVGKKQPFDWPQWQGPERTAISQEKGLLQSWPKEGPSLHWKTTGLGEGFSTPAVAAGRILLMGNRDKVEYVIALSEKDGKELWATAVGPVRSNGGGYPGPRCTPTVDGELLYALGLNGDLVCLDVAMGKEVWRKDLRKDFAGGSGGWGYSESPLVDGDKLLVTPGNKKATLAALNKKTGETIWTCQVPDGDRAAYSSVIAATANGQRQYVQFLSGGVVGVDAATGHFLWRYDAPANGTANITTPVFHDNHVFATSDYGTGGGLIKVNGKGVQEIYFTKKMRNHHGGLVLLDGHLYGADSDQLTCLDFREGTVRWRGKAGKGSICYADGRFYFRNEGGTITLIEANPEKYIEHGRFQQPDRSRSPAWAHPVVANGKLYIADQDVMFCYDVKQK